MATESKNSSDIYVRKQWFIKSNSSKLEDFYDFDTKKVIICVLLEKHKIHNIWIWLIYNICADLKVLGSGTYGSVYKAKKKDSKIVRAVKQIPKSKVKNKERF